MTNRIVGAVLSAVVLLFAPLAAADGATDLDRFKLWNDCRPMGLVVEELDDEETAIGLTKDVTSVAVRSRLRAGVFAGIAEV